MFSRVWKPSKCRAYRCRGSWVGLLEISGLGSRCRDQGTGSQIGSPHKEQKGDEEYWEGRGQCGQLGLGRLGAMGIVLSWLHTQACPILSQGVLPGRRALESLALAAACLECT